MRVFCGLPHPLHRQPSALAIGNFDGVHTGHQSLLRGVVEAASARGLQPAAVTFEPHPRERFRRPDDVLPRISTLYDKVLRILETGIQRVYILPFTRRLASLSAESFVRDVLSEGLDARWITVGEDFHFGNDRKGDIHLLEELGRECRYECFVSPTLFHTNARVSSSRIREALLEGDLVEASIMLGRRYSMTGRVIHGAALGRELGYPTLNMAVVPPGSCARPAITGVYAVRIHGLGYAVQNGVASVGRKPTVVSDGRWLLETHVFDWKGDAYGKIIRVEFIERIRDEKKFAGLAELQAAIQADAERARRILGFAAVG